MEWARLPGLRNWATIIYIRDYNSSKWQNSNPIPSKYHLSQSWAPCFMSANKHHTQKAFLGVSWSKQLEIEGTFIPDLLL
jgi:hypothetical protein